MDYASNAKGNTGVTLGAIGTGLGAVNALGGMGALAGLFGGGGVAPRQAESYVPRHEMDLVRELIDSKQANAILASENNTERKIVDVYANIENRLNAMNDKIDANYKEQARVNTDQAVWNGVSKAAMGGMRADIDEILRLTVRHVPATNICPEPMPKYNSWTAPTT